MVAMLEMRTGAEQDGIRRSKQHLSLPIYKRTKARLLIEVDAVAGLTISSISVPYDESIGDFVAKNCVLSVTRTSSGEVI